MKMLRWFMLFLLIVVAPAKAAERVALVIGNNNYPQSPLNNPINDAKAIGKTLNDMGFTVVDAYNADRDGMEEALADFGQQAEQADIAVIYYAGHGIQVDGQNYLVPANTPVKHRRDLRKLINLKELVSEAEQARGLGLVMVDACRDNPFSNNLQQSLGRSIGGRGLARVEDTPSNILVTFATKENAIALDGSGKHSPYAQALLQYLPQPNLEIRLLFGKVHDAVKQATGQRQKPYTYGALGGNEWYLAANTNQPSGTGNGSFWQSPLVAFAEPEMLDIRGDCFQMGQTATEKQWLIKQAGQADYNKYFDDEKRHTVCVEAFKLAKYEVTVADFRQFVQATGYKTDAEKNTNHQGCRAYEEGKWQWIAGRNWQNPGFAQSDNHPVVCVSWHDANAYAKWLQENTGKGYRLATEAEWEFAARAGTSSIRYWGNDKDNRKACSYANVADQTAAEKYNWSPIFACKDGYAETAPVGLFSANAWGLKDMLGNVWEWTCSAYDSAYAGAEVKCVNDNDSRSRVLRGGSWTNLPRNLRSAYRDWNTATIRNSLVGFRLARTR